MFINYSYSQDYKYVYSNGTYYAELQTSALSDDSTLNLNAGVIFVYKTKKSEYLIGVGLKQRGEYSFDIVNNTFTVETEEETFNYISSLEHLATDLSAFAFSVPFGDMKKFNEAKKVVLKALLVKDSEGDIKEIPCTINLNPGETAVFTDFYNFGLNK